MREDFLEEVTISCHQKDGQGRVGQGRWTRRRQGRRMAHGKAEEQARACDILGKLSGAGVHTACQIGRSAVAGTRSPRGP